MPSARLTAKAITEHRSLLQGRPDSGGPKKPIELNDTALGGLTCRVNPSGRCTFQLRYRDAGGGSRRHQIGTFPAMSVDQARDTARALLVGVQLGADPAKAKKAKKLAPRMSELGERFLSDHADVHKKPSSVKQDRRMIEKRLNPRLGSMLVRDVTATHVAELLNGLRATPTEANRVRALLHTMFNLAERWGLRDRSTNPVDGAQRFREKRRERLLTEGELSSIATALKTLEEQGRVLPGAALAIRLLFETGCRLSEITGLEWRFVDRDAEVIKWPDSKANEPMSKPLTVATAALLDCAERVVGNPYVCFGVDRSQPLSGRTLAAAWERTLAEAGVAHCGLHAIRHWLASSLANSGVPIESVRKILGHKTAATTFRYFQSTQAQEREALESLSKGRGGFRTGTNVVPLRANIGAKAEG